MFRKIFVAILLLLTFYSSAFPQSASDRWKSYLPYTQASKLAIAEDRVYCATSGGLFYYNTRDNSINKISREDGLSDTEISAIRFSSSHNALVITYITSNIDIIKNNVITNLPDIERKQIPGDKSIYNISFENDRAYLSTGFGIVVLDLMKNEFIETYIIGENGKRIKIHETAFMNNYVYAATDEGIYKAFLDSPNLVDYNYWERINEIPGYTGVFNTITMWNNTIFVNKKGSPGNNDVVYYLNGTAWEEYNNFSEEKCLQLNNAGEYLIITSEKRVDIYDIHENEIRHVVADSPQYADLDINGNLWIADKNKGLLRYSVDNHFLQLSPEGPISANVSDIEIKGNNIIAVGGGASSGMGNLFRNAELFRLHNNSWSNWFSMEVKDLYRVAIDPSNPEHYFAASWGYGLLEFIGNELVNIYGEENSSLQSIIPGDNFIRIGGIAFDNNNNLWLTNSGVAQPVSVFTKNGEWTGFSVGSQVNAPNLGRIIITRQNHKWIILPGGHGLFVLDDNNTPDNFLDDKYRKLSVVDNNSSIITNDIHSIAEDRNGNIWLGSNKGIIVFYSPERVFGDNLFYGQQILIPRKDDSGYADPLLGEEIVTAIAVDGANRKWLGTKNAGLFLVSHDGLEEIHSFNTANSPILSNSIVDIAINEKSGEVFIGTDKGIISYKGDAIAPNEIFNDVYVYPNPVREDFYGDIVITGLVAETIVKITDISGNIVYETISLGGQAIWNGSNFRGERVKTGVYLVFCSDSEGTLSVVTKLLFIN